MLLHYLNCFSSRANTVYLSYRLLEGAGQLRLRLRPGSIFGPTMRRPRNRCRSPIDVRRSATASKSPGRTASAHGCASASASGVFVLDGGSFYDVEYELERERGYAYRDMLWSPGYFRAELDAGEQVGPRGLDRIMGSHHRRHAR